MNKKILSLILLAAPMLFGACSDDDDNNGGGNPTISVSDIQPAQFGDSITVNVNCNDNVPLSTLKASLRYSEEEVENMTLRTKENGDYAVKLFIPYYKDVPDGDITLHLTLQNIQFKTSEQDVTIPVSRPHYDHLTLYVDKNTQYTMTPDASNPYLFHCTVHSPSSTTVYAYVIAPAADANGNEVTFGMGKLGVTQGVTDAIAFANAVRGDFECTFNTLTYEYSPVYDPSASAQELQFTADNLEYDGQFVQGRKYSFTVPADLQQDFWVDPDYFTANGDGTYTFNAVDGNYHIKVYTDRKGMQMWATDDNKQPLALADDGSGALWIIGDDGLAKPSYTNISGQGWWTDTDHALCFAQVKPKVYQITVTVGQQLRAGSINFKFFGQAGWGTEFHGTADAHHISTTNSIFLIGDGSGGHDNGNLYLSSDDAIKNGETYVLTVDLTQGNANGILTVTKK